MILKTYKNNRKVVCYITKEGEKYKTKTGKPSDASCLSWSYDRLEDAEKTAKEYFENRTNFFN